MRVCMMNDNFDRAGGAAIAIRRISEAVTDVDYYFVACLNDGQPEDISWAPEARFKRFDLKTSNPIRVIGELIRLKRWLAFQQCSLVHCHHRRLSVLLQLAGVPVLYTGHLAFGPARWFRYLHPRRMTAVSRSVALNILETTGRAVLKCIHNPAQFPKESPQVELNQVRNRAVCVARLEKVKAHANLLAAWGLLCQRGHRYELDLVGEGSLRAQLEAQVDQLGLHNLVRFNGFHQNISGFIEKSLFAILVSEVEGQPLAVLEAATMGRSTLLTAVPGSIDLIPPGVQLKNGLEFGNVVQLADALEEWFARPEEVIEDGKRFFNFIKSSSDPSTIAIEYKKVYDGILADCV